VLFVLATPFVSCQKSTLDLFDNPPSIYFTWLEQDNRVNVDVKFTFIVGDYDTVRIPVRVMGPLADYPRPVKVVVNPNRTFGAREGIHYRILDDLSFVPANSRDGFATILALRAEEIEDKREVYLGIRLEPNTHFRTDFDSIMNNTTQRIMRSVLDFGFTISDTLVKPDMWLERHTINHWGAFSMVKYRLILRPDIGGMPACFWESLCSFEGRWRGPADTEPVALRLRTYLQQNLCRSEDGLEELIVDEYGFPLFDVIRFWETLDCSQFSASPANPREPIRIIPIEQ
jgi:hypothetical protein